MHPRILWLIGVVLLASCSTPPVHFSNASNDPANAQSPEAPLPPTSQTLAIGESAEMVKAAGTMPGMMHGMHEQDAAHGASDMSGTKHPMPATKPGENAAPSAPQSTPTRFPATTQAATLYTCTMHPEVISDKPGKCPKCGMKLVVKKNAEHPGQGANQ
jgi:hypothetical protein